MEESTRDSRAAGQRCKAVLRTEIEEQLADALAVLGVLCRCEHEVRGAKRLDRGLRQPLAHGRCRRLGACRRHVRESRFQPCHQHVLLASGVQAPLFELLLELRHPELLDLCRRHRAAVDEGLLGPNV